MKVDKIANNRVKFTFNVTVDEFKEGLEYAYDQVKEDIEIKGFRKGNVPMKVYVNKFGVETLYEEALNHVFHHKYYEAVANEEYQLVGNPKPVVDFNNVTDKEEFEIALESAIKPEVELGEYKNIEVAKKEDKASEEEVEGRLNQLLSSNVQLEPKEEGNLEEGDTAIFDFEGFHNGEPFEGGKAENHELEIGSNQFIPGFEVQMVGMKVGEEKEINVTFPEQYHSEDLAGQDAVFKVKLHDIKVKVTPELNDEWVKSLEREEKTLDELKAALTKEIEESKKNQNKNIAIDEALTKIADKTKVDIPEEMIDYEVNQQLNNIENQAKQYGMDFATYVSLTGMTEEDLKARVKEDSEKKVLNSLIIEAISKAENFEVTKEDIASKYEEVAKMYQMEVAEVKQHLSDELISRDIEFAKAIDFIYDNLKFV